MREKDSVRGCPVCQARKSEILHHQKFKLRNDSLLPEQYDVVSCAACGFVYADTPASQDTYSRYYAEFSKYESADSAVSTGGGTSVWDKKRIEGTCDDLAKVFSPDQSVLDIGCANGGLLVALRNRGMKNLFGLDPSNSCVEYVNKQGIACYRGELFNTGPDLKGRKFDSVILSHVLEHICDLQRAAQVIHELLNDDGIAYIETPDAAAYCRYYVVPYYYFDPEHINHFDTDSIRNLFSRFGFECVSSGEKSFAVNDRMQYPAAFAFIRKTRVSPGFVPSHSGRVKTEVLHYLEMSAENQSYSEIERLAKEGTPVVVFGAGNFTARLLESTSLGKCRIEAFVDNDRKKQGTVFGKFPVFAPDWIHGFKGTVLVCSALFHEQIVNQLRNELQIKNEIVVIR